MKRTFLAAAFTLSLAACSGTNSASSQFIGNWTNIKNPNQTLAVIDNGDNLLAKLTSPNDFSGKPETQTTPAIVKNGTLQLQADIGPITMTIDRSTGHLVGADAEFKRSK